MNIDKHTYEAYFLDYLEGRLTPDQEAAVLLFLEAHPGLRAELEGFEMVQLEASDEITFPSKNELKWIGVLPAIHGDNDEDHFVASLENQLSTQQEEDLQNYLEKFPTRRPVFDDYQRMRLLPDPAVTFIDKRKLKKRDTKVIRLYWYAAAAAACWFVAIGPWLDLLRERDVETNVAVVSQEIRDDRPLSPSLQLSHPLSGVSVPQSFPVGGGRKSSVREAELHHDVVRPDNDTEVVRLPEMQDESHPENVAIAPGLLQKEKEDHVLPDEKIQVNQSEVTEVASKQQPVVVKGEKREFSSINSWIASIVKRKVLNADTASSMANATLSEAISTQVSKAVGADLEIEKDNHGDVLAYAIKFGKLEFSRKTGKN